MENKNLDGQLSFDGELGLNNSESENSKNAEVPVVEFEIGTPAKEESFIFEVSKEFDKKDEEIEITEPIVEEFVIGTPPSAPKPVKAPSEEAEEKSSEEDKAPVQQTNPTRRAVYVPRFTEASEKYRKMVDTRSRASMQDMRRSAKVEISDTSDFSAFKLDENIDPTAEIDAAPESQVLVNLSTPQPEPEMLNVFKFREEEAVKQEVVEEEPTLETEIEEIERLIAKDPEPEVEAEEDTVAEESAESESECETSVEEISNSENAVVPNYELPDPDGSVMIQEYNGGEENKPVEELPDFVMVDSSQDSKAKRSEFTHQSQRDSFKDMFLDSGVAHKIRMGMIGVFSFILFVFELLASLGKISTRVLHGSTFFGALATIDLILVCCVFMLALPETVRAIKKLCKKDFSFELALPVGFVVILLYAVVLIAISARKYALYGFIFALYALVAVVASYYRTLGDFIAFKQVSKNTEKKILDIKMTRELPEENVALDGLVDEFNSKTSRIFRAAFVADFFERTSRNTEKKNNVLLLFAIPFGAALLSALIALFIPGGAVAAISAFTLVFLVSCPVFVMLSGKIPYFDAQSVALSEESTVIGEKSYLDFAEVDVIAFEDTEIFGTEDVNLKRFILYGDRDNIDRAMRQMYSIFSVVGGPLYKIFAKALDNRIRHTPATDVQIEVDGVSGDISGTRIFAGSDTYMQRHGIAVPQGTGPSEFGADTTKVMYAAENGEVYAKFYIRYSFSEEFTMLLPSLKKENIVPLIYTNDPNLSNELLQILSAGADCMRVVKKLEPRTETERIYRRVGAGLVTYGDKINAINTILLTRKYKLFADRISISALYSLSIAAAVALVISTLGMSIPSIVYGLWHIGWCIALRLVSMKNFEEEKKEKENK